jgi:hypothetical protein
MVRPPSASQANCSGVLLAPVRFIAAHLSAAACAWAFSAAFWVAWLHDMVCPMNTWPAASTPASAAVCSWRLET